MYPLSAFVTLLDGSLNNITNTFTESQDYFLSGKSVFLALSSTKLNDIYRVYTSPLSSLDYITASSDNIPNLLVFAIGSNQPYLSGEDRYFYKTVTNGFLSGHTFKGRNLIIYPQISFVTVTHSEFDNSGNIDIRSSDLASLYIHNCAVSGIFISLGVELSALTYLYFGNTYLAGGTGGNFETFLAHLCTYGPNNGFIYQTGEAGYQGSPPSNFNPFTMLNYIGQTAMHHLTTIKGWGYSYNP